MPVVTIDMWSGRDKETKRKLIQSVSKAVAESLGIEIERVEIILNEVPKDNWGKNGKQASEL